MAKQIIEFTKKNMVAIISVIFMSGAVYASIQSDRQQFINQLRELSAKDQQIKRHVDQVDDEFTEALLDSTKAMTSMQTTISTLVERVGRLQIEQQNVVKAVSQLQGRVGSRQP